MPLQYGSERAFRATTAAELAAATGDVAALQGDVTTAQGDISALQTSVSNLEAAVAALPTSMINSIQKGTIVVNLDSTNNNTNTATLSQAVDPAKSVCLLLGVSTTSVIDVPRGRVELTDATTVTAYGGRSGSGGTWSVTIGYAVIEYV